MASVDLNMDEKQLQPRGTYALAHPIRQRGLWGQIWMALLQPGQFFGVLPAIDQTRQWLWAGLLILALIGFSAVRQVATPVPDPNAFQVPTDTSTEQPPGGKPLGSDFGVPPGVGVPGGDVGTDGATTSNVSSNWTTALLAASGIVVGWFIQCLLLCEVSLLRGFSPRLGRNLQIAIWASLPLGLMAVVQLIYYAAGGTIAGAGVSGLVTEIPGYANMSPYIQAILLSFATQLTLFWLWSLALIYIGARRALQGRWWSSVLVVIAWVVIIVLVPVITGAIKAPEADLQSIDNAGGIDAESLGLSPEEVPEQFRELMSESGVSETAEPGAVEEQPAVPLEPTQAAEGTNGARKG